MSKIAEPTDRVVTFMPIITGGCGVSKPPEPTNMEQLFAKLDAAIAATEQAAAEAEEPWPWELSLRGLRGERERLSGEVGEPPEPAPVATVVVECHKCKGKGQVSYHWVKGRGWIDYQECPTCLGAGILHTHAEFLAAIEAAKEAVKEASLGAEYHQGDGAVQLNGAADVDGCNVPAVVLTCGCGDLIRLPLKGWTLEGLYPGRVPIRVRCPICANEAARMAGVE